MSCCQHTVWWHSQTKHTPVIGTRIKNQNSHPEVFLMTPSSQYPPPKCNPCSDLWPHGFVLPVSVLCINKFASCVLFCSTPCLWHSPARRLRGPAFVLQTAWSSFGQIYHNECARPIPDRSFQLGAIRNSHAVYLVVRVFQQMYRHTSAGWIIGSESLDHGTCICWISWKCCPKLSQRGSALFSSRSRCMGVLCSRPPPPFFPLQSWVLTGWGQRGPCFHPALAPWHTPQRIM